ncbi:MAG: hypothetical protein JWO70_1147 [Betaproteobacteria bacterium]|nr:hypothetical protein [Betaproteobacteria bacterium]
MPIHFGGLRARLVLLVLLALVPAAALILYNASGEHEALVRAQRDDNARLMRLVAMQQARLLEGTHHLLVALSHTGVVRNDVSDACGEYLAELIAQYSWYGVFGVATTDGDVRCHSRKSGRMLNIADRSYFTRALQAREFTVGEYQIGRATGRPSFSVAYPVLDDGGRVSAVIFASVRMDEFERLAREIALPASAMLLTTDRHGVVLSAYPDKAYLVGQKLQAGPLLDAASRGVSGTVQASAIDGIDRVYSYTMLNTASGPALFTAIGIPRTDMLQAAYRELARNLGGLAAVIVLSLAAAVFGGNAFVLRPVQRLASAARRLARGEFAARSGSARAAGELGELAAAFDDMAQALQARDAASARLGAIVDSSDDAIVGKDLKGIVTSWNPGAERLFGYPAHDMVGTSITRLIPPERSGEEEHIQSRISRGERIAHFDTVRVTRDGRLIDVSVTISPIRDASGEIVGASKVARDIGERLRTQHALEAANERLQALSVRLLETQEAERHTVAYELHDELCQSLAAIKMNVQSVHRRMPSPQLKESLHIADAALQRVRALSVDLRPPQLTELGLEAALRACVERESARSGLAAHFRSSLGATRLRPDLEANCFRIAQKALANVVAHAGARNVWVELTVSAGELELTLVDDGAGFDVAAVCASLSGAGIADMKQRVALAGGRIEIVSSKELGTEISLVLPLLHSAPA